MYHRVSLSARRAWIEIPALLSNDQNAGSLSARRAWIEIILFVNLRVLDGVALRKESVDRNDYKEVLYMGVTVLSLSARRAWIEMLQHC